MDIEPSAIEKATTHFRQRLNGELLSLDVPDWGENGKPMFQEGHMGQLMHETDPDVVSGIVTKMGQESDDHETLKKT